MIKRNLYTHTTKRSKKSFIETISENLLLFYFISITIGYFYIQFTDPSAILYDKTALDGQDFSYWCGDPDKYVADILFNTTMDGEKCYVTALANTPRIKDDYSWYYYGVQIQWYVTALGILHILVFKRKILKRKYESVIKWMERIK